MPLLQWIDPKLLGRVKLYLQQQNADKSVVDVEQMSEDLRRKFGEYGRKKKNVFTPMVQRAVDQIQKSHANVKSGEKRKASSPVVVSDDDFSSDNQNYVQYEDKNLANNSITSLYNNTPKMKRVQSEPNFIIDTVGSPMVVTIDDEPTTSVADVKTVKLPEEKFVGKTTPKVKTPKSSKGATDKAERKETFTVEIPSITFQDIGGCESALLEICKLLLHLKHPEIYRQLGVVPPRGFLLHGPPGCGKTLFAHAIAGEFQLPFIKLAAPEIITGVSGESEQKLRDLFDRAVAASPCIVFIDEIDSVTPKRETAQREMERRIVAQLLACLDDLAMNPNANVLVIGATNRPDSLDPALRRAGRFDKEISLRIPDEPARTKIIQVVCRKLRLAPEFNFGFLARNTPGYVGADLAALAQEASVYAVERTLDSINSISVPIGHSQQETLDKMLAFLKSEVTLESADLTDLFVEMRDFQKALKSIHPSAKREGFTTVPDVTWADIGALEAIREELKWSILYPIQCPEEFESLGLNAKPQGILLCGPPGCGKTLLAKAVANETGMNFISVKGPELLSMYVGESEKAVRQVFQRAQSSAPCVIFFDELDALCPRRSDHDSGGTVRVVNQLLTEMDGIEGRKKVFIMGATNRPDIIDPAVMRPGRLDKVLYVGFPTVTDRADILRALTKSGTQPQIETDVNMTEIASLPSLEFYTGADLAALVREASVAALREFLTVKGVATMGPISSQPVTGVQRATACVSVAKRHFDAAVAKVSPSVSEKERKRYEELKLKYGCHC